MTIYIFPNTDPSKFETQMIANPLSLWLTFLTYQTAFD